MTERDPSPDLQHLFQLAMGYMPAVALNIVVKLGIPDLLAGGPLRSEQLSRKTGVNEDRLYRIMRALSAVGIFKETEGRSFEHSPASELLRTDHPMSQRDIVNWLSDSFHFQTYAHLLRTVKTGESAMELAAGKPVFDFFRDDPDEGQVFNAAMVNFTRTCIGAILDAYDFSTIIHDWEDDKALTILNNIRNALQGAAGGKVILLEAVVAAPGEPDMAKWIDLEMMAGPGGRERTREEFQRLFDKAGFRMSRIVPTKSPLSVIEAGIA
jgi:O-methyltransferase